MPNFKIVNNVNAIPAGTRWTSVGNFNSKVKIVDNSGNVVGINYQGRKYLIVEKKEYTYSKPEHFGRGLVGVIAIVCSLFIALCFKPVKNYVKNLFNAKKTVYYAVPLTPKQEKLINRFTPQMVEALGGINEVINMPKMPKTWDGTANPSSAIAPIARGKIKTAAETLPILVFCLIKKETSGPAKVELDFLRRNDSSLPGWQGKTVMFGCPGQLDFGTPDVIVDRSNTAKFMLDKIRRLVQGEAIGILERYPNVVIVKPADRNIYRPGDSFLQGQELEDYMDGGSFYYEKKPTGTDVFLYDPTITRQQNIDKITSKFPEPPDSPGSSDSSDSPKTGSAPVLVEDTIYQKLTDRWEMLEKARAFAKGDAKLFDYIKKIYSFKEFQADPKAYLANWKVEKGGPEEILEEGALAFFNQLYPSS